MLSSKSQSRGLSEDPGSRERNVRPTFPGPLFSAPVQLLLVCVCVCVHLEGAPTFLLVTATSVQRWTCKGGAVYWMVGPTVKSSAQHVFV